MLQVQKFRVLVMERLSAAAEDISEWLGAAAAEKISVRLSAAADYITGLFERTVVEYEEELRRSKENQREQQILTPTVPLLRVDTVFSLRQLHTETPQIKEEAEEESIKQEEEQLPVSIPESSGLCVKSEESSEIQQRETEPREETQGDDSKPRLHSETEGHDQRSSDMDSDDDWKPPFSCSSAQTETEADVDQQHNQVQKRSTRPTSQNKSAAEKHASVKKGETSGRGRGAERKKHLCFVCHKSFGKMLELVRHMRVHTGERPYSCSVCKKTFNQKSNLETHKRTHTGKKPFSCSNCEKIFTQRAHLETHKITHTGERPYKCSTCKKTFTRKDCLETHKRTHTGERPFTCTVCNKAFRHKQSLKSHMISHKGRAPQV